MSRSTKRLLFGGLILFGFLAILNPGYNSVYVQGPNGVIKTEKFKFGPGGLLVYTRVVADESSVLIEQL
ncbi:hypothetical protein [Zavarzinella formosa]|uniref:hypothetical protein n=1 Tax=Zavarzinella formosa TaxID=360055 RepID=UPI000306B0B5|nr:hypothetical protein [Zavarzinella formosa]